MTTFHGGKNVRRKLLDLLVGLMLVAAITMMVAAATIPSEEWEPTESFDIGFLLFFGGMAIAAFALVIQVARGKVNTRHESRFYKPGH